MDRHNRNNLPTCHTPDDSPGCGRYAQDAFLLAVGVNLPLDFSVYLPTVLKDQ
jgi:hypothetical protein